MLADDSMSNSFPVTVHEPAAESDPMVANVPSSLDTVKVHSGGVNPDVGTL